jgi:hypothetical protein
MFDKENKGVIGSWEVVIIVITLVVVGLVIWRVTLSEGETAEVGSETTADTDSDTVNLQTASIPGINVDYVLNPYTRNLVFEDMGDELVGVGSTLVTDYIHANYPKAEYACEALYFLNTQTKDETLPADAATDPLTPRNQAQIDLAMAEGLAIEINNGETYLFASAGVEPCEIFAGDGQVPDDSRLAALMATEREEGMTGLISAIEQALR